LDDSNLRSIPFSIIALAVSLLIFAGVRTLDNDYLFFAGYTILQFMVLATAWNILGGYTGYMNLGVAAFFALGGYTTVFFHKSYPLPIPILIVIAGIISGVVGLALGSITLRLRGSFFAIVTLALPVALHTLVVNWDFLGGSRGVYIIRPREVPILCNYIQYLFLIMLLLAVVAVATARAVERSQLGRRLAAIRDDEPAAKVEGFPALRLKLIATTLSTAFMGMAGAPFPYYIGYLEPDSMIGSLQLSVNSIAMPIYGGITSWVGPVSGALVLETFEQTVTVTASSAASLLFVCMVLVISVISAPNGITGEATRLSIVELAQCKVISLDSYERRLVGTRFLSELTSGLFVAALLLFVLLSMTTRNRWLLSLTALSMIFAVVWSFGLSYMWRKVILIVSWVAYLSVIGTGVQYYLGVATSPGDTKDSFPYLPILVFALLPLVLASHILSDGFGLARIPTAARSLFVAVAPGRGLAEAIAAVFGIHPICRWLSSAWHRLIASALFVLTATAQGLVVFSAVLAVNFVSLGGAVVAVFFVPVAGLLRFFARRFSRVSLEKLTKADQRAPILFLRSFRDDQVVLDRAKRGFIRAFVDLGEPHPALDHILLEEFTPWGPVVAIGMPGAAPPFGAARTYVDDDEWRNIVAKLATDARAIVIVVDESEGVKWELSYLLDNGHLPKTLCLLPPRLAIDFKQFVQRPEQSAEIIRAALRDQNHTLTPLQQPCIGWYRASGGDMVLLTSNRPSQASYVCAMRLFHENQIHASILHGESASGQNRRSSSGTSVRF
jgi:branched-chain amino acid transport system permease protein